MVAGRYRIVGLLGRGGMGEVYRADDLKLGQPVALKFLPPGLENDPDRLGRFLSEVRTARQVTHPNVCRVFDIDEVDGQHFLSMEYVDGEDLSSLLLRIGRLPQERAIEVARQICAGLSAAHEQGILHRDLKPANIMIDGRGQVRLTDFGLASLVEDIDQTEIDIGTPAYMAPEQIAGREVTVRSDIYSLGLVLYELFTGRRTFDADNVAEMQRMHTSTTPSDLTRHVQDLDPTVERAVLRCLEKNPADRPSSALAISAALPGGDPLAAALAAGETPSPELVANAGERCGMKPSKAILLGLAGLLLIMGSTRWAGQQAITNYLPLDRRPEVLEDRARGIIAELGYTEDVYADPVDNAWGLMFWSSVIDEIAEADTTGAPWDALRSRPDAVSFWYRQSPETLRPQASNPPIFQRGPVNLTNPLPIIPGEVSVLLDAAGQLRRFQVTPNRYSTADTIGEVDWSPLFALAGLDTARFTEDRPRYQRYIAPDRRRAWSGTLAARPEVNLWVEAGSYESRPVLFNVSTIASIEWLGLPPARQEKSPFWYLNSVLLPLVILLIIATSIRVSGQNFKQGRADRRGALRFGILTFSMFLLGSCLVSHTMFTSSWANEIWPIIVGATFIGLASWSLYSAAEPLGRQVWPTMFISSSRLLSRPRIQWLDPLLGKSVLIGLLAGGLEFLLSGPVRQVVLPLVTGETVSPMMINTTLLQGQRQVLGLVLNQAMLLTYLLILVMALILIRKMIRSLPLALTVTLFLWTILIGAHNPESAFFSFVSSAIMMIVLLRWGVVAMVISRIVVNLAWRAQAADWSAWHSQSAALILALFAGLVVYGVWAAIGDRREQVKL